jgi:hypothetical protein
LAANKAQVLARERSWATRAGAAAILGSVLALVGFVLLRAALSGSANFEGLEEAHEHSSTVWLSGILTLIGSALLVGPLLYLFNAARARSTQMRQQLVGVVVLGPLLLGIGGVMLAAGTQEAANNYLEGKSKSTLTASEANKECKEDEEKKGAKAFGEEFEAAGGKTGLQACEAKKQNEDRASNSIKDSTLVSLAQFFGLAGGLALVIGLLYTCQRAMRVGLLTRFWGSLGMAVGVAALIGFSPIMFLWFIYLGLLIAGWLPGSRPAAWEAGEAVPWTTPGQRAAASLEPSEPAETEVDEAGGAIEAPEPPEVGNGDGGGEPRRKRKKRD